MFSVALWRAVSRSISSSTIGSSKSIVAEVSEVVIRRAHPAADVESYAAFGGQTGLHLLVRIGGLCSGLWSLGFGLTSAATVTADVRHNHEDVVDAALDRHRGPAPVRRPRELARRDRLGGRRRRLPHDVRLAADDGHHRLRA